MLNNRFRRLANLPYGARFQSSSISNKLGKTWLVRQSLTTFHPRSTLASTIFANGTTKSTKLMFISFASVCILFIMMPYLMYNVALDPNYKVAYAKGKWEPRDFDEGMRSLRKVFDKYYHCNVSPATAEPAAVAPSLLARQGSYGHSWMRDAVKTRVANDTANRRPHQELDEYLAAPLEDVENIVAWWGVSFFASCFLAS